jgi:hypothetical protein
MQQGVGARQPPGILGGPERNAQRCKGAGKQIERTKAEREQRVPACGRLWARLLRELDQPDLGTRLDEAAQIATHG